MLNDCWPATVGWSLCDYYVRAKAGHYALKSYKQPVTGYVEKVREGYMLHITNILKQNVECDVRAMVLNFKTGSKRGILQEKSKINSEKVEWFLDIEITKDEMIVSEVAVEDKRHRSWYKNGLPKLEKTETLQWKQTSYGIEVWSDDYVHAIEIEGVEELEDNYFSLLPGEKRSIRCQSNEKAEVSGYSFV